MNHYQNPGYLTPVNDRTRDKAENILDNPKNNKETAKQLFEWVRDNYCWDMMKIESSEALIDRGPSKAMSFSQSNLLISLLRSKDIPARINFINCQMRNEIEDTVEDSIHGPVEIKIDGEWVVADPTYGPHTEKYHNVSKFGEKTWEEVSKSEKKSELDRSFVLGYNYIFRFVHPDVRSIKKQLRQIQDY